MKTARHVIPACLMAAALFSSGCNYAKPIMYINIANHSGSPMENLELQHPTGSFGLPELRNDQTHRRLVPIGAPCKFSIKFEDQSRKKHEQSYDLGPKCPMEITFEVGTGMNISEKTGQP